MNPVILMLPQALISHRPEPLADLLIEQLRAEWRTWGLVPLEIVVPNHETARWLTLRIADTLGICTLIRFSYPERFFQERLQKIPRYASTEPPSGPSSRHAWTLRIRERMATHAHEMPGITPETNRMPIAAEWASVIETCSRHRIEWWHKWRQFESPEAIQSFQPRIWDFLFCADTEPPSCLYYDWANAIKDGVLSHASAASGPAVHFFGFWTMTPVEIGILRALAGHSPVKIYAVLPTGSYLQDVDRHSVSHDLEGDESPIPDTSTISSLYSIHAELGSLAREMQALLIEHTDFNAIDDPDTAHPQSLLHRLQLAIHDPETPLPPIVMKGDIDPSMGVHSCTSRRRELEVLKALIQQRIEAEPGLSLENIRVYSPDPDAYAGHLHMVFGFPGDPDAIPVRIQHPGSDGPEGAARAALEVLSLIPSEWKLQDWQSLLESPAVMQGLGWDMSMSQTAYEWLRNVGTRAGIDPHHLGQIDSSRDPSLTARAAIQRLLNAWCTHPEPGSPKLLEAPFHPEWAGSGELLEHLVRLVSGLQHWIHHLKPPRKVSEWTREVRRMTEALFPSYRESDSLQGFRQALLSVESLTLSDHSDPEIPVNEFVWFLKDWLMSHGSTSPASTRSGIPIAPIRPHILLPCDHLFLIGMEESAFPRARQLLASRLLGLSPRKPCDPAPRNEDRLWILQSVMHAKRSWNAIFVGQSERDMLLRPPAAPVQSIIDYVNSHLAADPVESSEPLLKTVLHPGAAHHPDCFTGDHRFAHYSRIDYETACILRDQRINPTPEPQLFQLNGVRENERQAVIEFSDLFNFITHPLRYYCTQILGIRLPNPSDHEPEDEVSYWNMEGLKTFHVKNTIVDILKRGCETNKGDSTIEPDRIRVAALRHANQRKLLPTGRSGIQWFNEIFDEVWDRFGESTINDHRHWLLGREVEEARIMVGPWLIQAPKLKPGINPRQKMLLGLPAKQKARYLLAAWLTALLMRRVPGQESMSFSLLLNDKTTDLDCHDPDIIQPALEQWINAYIRSRTEPFYAYTETGYTWVNKKRLDPTFRPEFLSRDEAWKGDHGECADPYIRFMRRDRDPFDNRFMRDSEQIIQPLFLLSEDSGQPSDETREST